MQTTKDPGPQGTEPSQLADLLACELELADLLARTQDEARRLVDEARAEVSRADAELEASLEAESEGVRARIREETQGSMREVAARARARVAMFEGVSEQRVVQLAESAFRRLIGLEDPT